CLQYNAKPFTF
nr:immunoglobulin light chain junction region [Macaca mulatta]